MASAISLLTSLPVTGLNRNLEDRKRLELKVCHIRDYNNCPELPNNISFVSKDSSEVGDK